MQLVILAGGMQSSISNEREGIPKPMVELGGKPILWHIMKHFSEYGIKEFIICGGYRIDIIKEYFMDFYIYESDITVDLSTNTIQIHKNKTENWKVTVVDTGIDSATGQRVAMAKKYIHGDNFIVTYGDTLSDIDVNSLLDTHQNKGKMATVSFAKPMGRNQLFSMGMDGEIKFSSEHSETIDSSWVNADCFVFNKKVFKHLEGNNDLEIQLLVRLSKIKETNYYCHRGYWTTIETKRDLVAAEDLWNKGIAPWMK